MSLQSPNETEQSVPTGVKVRDLTISRGGTTVIQDVSLTIRPGEVLGLIGPNGAGKSSTVGGLLGFHPIQSGWIAYSQWTVRAGDEIPADMKRAFAYIPEQPMYYPDLTLQEHLEWKARLWQAAPTEATLPNQAMARRVDDLCRRFQLLGHMDKFPHQCSKGTLQKLMIVSAFLFPFDVLIVDEPFIGLDVISIRQIRLLLEEARQNGAAILVSTHVLDSAERMCQQFAFMMDGEVFASGSLSELRNLTGLSEDSTLEDIFVTLFEKHSGNVFGDEENASATDEDEEEDAEDGDER